MELMDGEQVLVTSDNDTLTLTSHRLRHKTKSDVVSIMLDQLCSCGIVYRDHRWLLMAAGASVIAALAVESYRVVGLVIGAVLVVAFFVTRYQILTLSSGGESIDVKIKGGNLEKTLGFIDSVEAAKNHRYMLRVKSSALVAESERPQPTLASPIPKPAVADTAPKPKLVVCMYCGRSYAEGQICGNCKI